MAHRARHRGAAAAREEFRTAATAGRGEPSGSRDLDPRI
jgi:hypothetical protein